MSWDAFGAQVAVLVNRTHVSLPDALPSQQYLLFWDPAKHAERWQLTINTMFTEARSNIITSTILPHIPAPALNIPHNKATGSDKSYYFQPSHLEARGKANVSLDDFRWKQLICTKKFLEAEHMPNTARQGHEKIGVFICWVVHNIEGEAGSVGSWEVPQEIRGGWLVSPTSRSVGNVWGVNAG